jgi:hypothetical protein
MFCTLLEKGPSVKYIKAEEKVVVKLLHSNSSPKSKSSNNRIFIFLCSRGKTEKELNNLR